MFLRYIQWNYTRSSRVQVVAVMMKKRGGECEQPAGGERVIR